MQCKVCQGQVGGACTSCGGFYCARHGGRTAYGSLCTECYDGRRPFFALAALLEIGLGIYCLFLASAPRAGQFATVFVLLALGGFGLACFCGWCALRRFPGIHEPGGPA